MSKTTAGRTGNKRRGARRERGPVRRALLWSVITVVSYGLTLTVASDTFFWFAIPGVLGLLTVVMITTNAALRRFPGDDDVKGLAKRYGLIVLVAGALIAIPWVSDIRYLYPLMGIGMMILFAGPKVLADQRRGA